MTATAIARRHPEPAEDRDELEQIRREIDAILPEGRLTPVRPDWDAERIERMRKLANQMVARYREGVPLVRIASDQGASIAWVRLVIGHYADLPAPDIAEVPAVNMPGPRAPERTPGPAGGSQPRRRPAKVHGRDENRKRAAQMAAALAANFTLDEIGRKHGCTRERVRQLINEFSDRTVPQILAARKAEEAARAKAKRDADTRRVQAWSRQHPGAPVTDAAALYGLTATEVQKMLGKRRNLHSQVRNGDLTVWSDEQLLALLRRFHAETGHTDGGQFEKWSRANGGPSKPTIMLRFGKWNLALAKAGVEKRQARRHQCRYEENDLWACLVEFLAGPRPSFTLRGFEEWARAIPGAPSGALLRVRLGESWVPLRNRAAAVLVDPSGFDPEWVADVTTRRDWARFAEGTVCREQAVAHIRDAIADLGPDLPALGYERWATQKDRPALDTLLRSSRLSWSQIVEAAGGNPRPPYRAPRTREEVTKALLAFFAEHPDGNCDGYKAWASANRRPSLSTVIKHYGSWTLAKQWVQEA